MDNKNYISIRGFAKQISVSEGAVRKAIKEGKLKGAYDEVAKKINVAKAKKAAWVQQQSVIKPKAGVSRAKAIEKIEQQNNDEVAALPITDKDVKDAQDVIRSIKITKDMDYKQAMKYREIVGLAMDKIKLQQAQGVLVEKAEVEKVLYKFGDELKRGLLDIPKRVVRDIMVAPNEVEATNILTDELTQVLLKFSDIKNFN